MAMATATMTKVFVLFFVVATCYLPALAVAAESDCATDTAGRDKAQALRLKVIAIFCILAGSAVGAALPSLGSRFPAIQPETDVFLSVKAFAGGVILATGLVHILPAAFEALSSPCLVGGPWKSFPFAGMVAMVSAIGTLIVDTVATGYFQRTDAKRKAAAVADEPDDLEASDEHSHGHAHGMSVMSVAPAGEEDLVRHRVISQVCHTSPATAPLFKKQSCERKNATKLRKINQTCCSYFLIDFVLRVLVGGGAGAGSGGALAHHRDVAGRLRLPEHGAAARAGADVSSVLRGHRARRMHRSGQVPGQVSGDDGALLLPHDAGRHRRRDRNLLRLRREQPDGAGGAGAPRGGGGGDTRLHGARRHPRRGLHEDQGAEQGTPAARHERLVAARRRAHVHDRHLGVSARPACNVRFNLFGRNGRVFVLGASDYALAKT